MRRHCLDTRTRVFSSDGGFSAARGRAASPKTPPTTRGGANSGTSSANLATNVPPASAPTSRVYLARRASPLSKGGDGNTRRRAVGRGRRGKPSQPRTIVSPSSDQVNTENQEPPSRIRETRTIAHPRATTTTTRPSTSGQRSQTGCKLRLPGCHRQRVWEPCFGCPRWRECPRWRGKLRERGTTGGEKRGSSTNRKMPD